MFLRFFFQCFGICLVFLLSFFLMNVFASFCICFAFFRIFGNVVGLESVSPRGYVGCSKLYIICLAAPSALDWGDKVCRWFVVGRNVTA